MSATKKKRKTPGKAIHRNNTDDSNGVLTTGSNPSSPFHPHKPSLRQDSITALVRNMLPESPADQMEHIFQNDAMDENVHANKDDELMASNPASFPSSARTSSGPSEDGAIFDEGPAHSSPTTSQTSGHHEDEIMSELPDDLLPTSPPEGKPRAPYTPTKQHQHQRASPFRHPSSVRAMQMDVTPPFSYSPYISSPRSLRHRASASSKHSTPRSVHAKRLTPAAATKEKREYPLVLLHVTLLPIVLPYSLELMTAVLPESIMENYNLLRDKVNETTLERGILLAHPKEDYELLEERLLESLELRLPRILKCGHFHPPDDLDAGTAEESEDEVDEQEVADKNDLDICNDCGRRIRDGRMGCGSGVRRWNIKIYAANGLMRAGAWAAAWREMERVDVEIEPWIPEDLRRELEAKKEQIMEEEAKDEQLVQDQTEEEDPVGSVECEQREGRIAEQEQQMLREMYGEDTAIRTPNVSRTGLRPSLDHELRNTTRASEAPHETRQWSRSPSFQRKKRRGSSDEIPLSTLLRNYLLLTASDKRNIAIVGLILAVILLALRPSPSPPIFHRPEMVSNSPSSAPAAMEELATLKAPPPAAPPLPSSSGSVIMIEASTASSARTRADLPSQAALLQPGHGAETRASRDQTDLAVVES